MKAWWRVKLLRKKNKRKKFDALNFSWCSSFPVWHLYTDVWVEPGTSPHFLSPVLQGLLGRVSSFAYLYLDYFHLYIRKMCMPLFADWNHRQKYQGLLWNGLKCKLLNYLVSCLLIFICRANIISHCKTFSGSNSQTITNHQTVEH